MTRKIVCLLFLALPVFAQQPAEKPVAVVNGRAITNEQLDSLYAHLTPQMREQYEKTGGKSAFLDNYINQQLVIAQATSSGFDRKPNIEREITEAKDTALFQAYVRDVVAASIVPEAAVRQYYDEHLSQFSTPERVHVRHIIVSTASDPAHPRSKEQALEKIQKVATELRAAIMPSRSISDPKQAAAMRVSEFAALAKKYSEDASAQVGGDLGWVTKDALDPDFAGAAWFLPIGMPSGIIETKFGYHLIMVEDKKPAGVQSFDEVRTSIRDSLLGQKMPDVLSAVSRLATELRSKAKVTVYPENIK